MQSASGYEGENVTEGDKSWRREHRSETRLGAGEEEANRQGVGKGEREGSNSKCAAAILVLNEVGSQVVG